MGQDGEGGDDIREEEWKSTWGRAGDRHLGKKRNGCELREDDVGRSRRWRRTGGAESGGEEGRRRESTTTGRSEGPACGVGQSHSGLCQYRRVHVSMAHAWHSMISVSI